MNEFEFIKNIKKKYGLDLVGDDCAVLPRDNATDLLISTDMLVEDIDFRLDWTTPEMLGHKALAVSLSVTIAQALDRRDRVSFLAVATLRLDLGPDLLDLAIAAMLHNPSSLSGSMYRRHINASMSRSCSTSALSFFTSSITCLCSRSATSGGITVFLDSPFPLSFCFAIVLPFV